MNTPQFRWVKSRLPRKGQPVPPIYQPEIAAEAIVWASEHDRRELLVGLPTIQAILGNKFLPGLGDWYLGRNGVEAQMGDEPQDPNQPYNLWEPLPGDRGAHGAFDQQARNRRWELQLSIHRNTILGGLALIGGLAAGLAWSHSSSRPDPT
jgi:hypothetical protein